MVSRAVSREKTFRGIPSRIRVESVKLETIVKILEGKTKSKSLKKLCSVETLYKVDGNTYKMISSILRFKGSYIIAQAIIDPLVPGRIFEAIYDVVNPSGAGIYVVTHKPNGEYTTIKDAQNIRLIDGSIIKKSKKCREIFSKILVVSRVANIKKRLEKDEVSTEDFRKLLVNPVDLPI